MNWNAARVRYRSVPSVAIGSVKRHFAALLLAGATGQAFTFLTLAFLTQGALSPAPAAISLSRRLIQARQKINHNECADRGHDHNWRA